MRQPKRRSSNPPEHSPPRKKIPRKRASRTPSPPNADTTRQGSRPVRARIFRDGKSYILPALMQPAPAASSSSTLSSNSSLQRAPAAQNVQSPNPPYAADSPSLERPSLQEAWHLNFPHTRLLTDMQTVGRHVRLLLPEDGRIVYPSSTPSSPPTTTAAIPAIPEPDPSSWAGQYPEAYNESRVSAKYYGSWLHTPPTVAEALENLMAARLEIWRDSHLQLARLQTVERQLLDVRHSLELIAINAEETS